MGHWWLNLNKKNKLETEYFHVSRRQPRQFFTANLELYFPVGGNENYEILELHGIVESLDCSSAGCTCHQIVNEWTSMTSFNNPIQSRCPVLYLSDLRCPAIGRLVGGCMFAFTFSFHCHLISRLCYSQSTRLRGDFPVSLLQLPRRLTRGPVEEFGWRGRARLTVGDSASMDSEAIGCAIRIRESTWTTMTFFVILRLIQLNRLRWLDDSLDSLLHINQSLKELWLERALSNKHVTK